MSRAFGLTEADRSRDSLFAHLHEDLAKLAAGHGLWPDLVVVTGDLTQRGVHIHPPIGDGVAGR